MRTPKTALSASDEPRAYVEPTPAKPLARFKLYLTEGDSHICGRAPQPIVFEPTVEDQRPHAFVPRSLGDWLIETEGRYEWAPESNEE